MEFITALILTVIGLIYIASPLDLLPGLPFDDLIVTFIIMLAWLMVFVTFVVTYWYIIFPLLLIVIWTAWKKGLIKVKKLK